MSGQRYEPWCPIVIIHSLYRFPVQVWRDDEARKIRMDTYGGVNTLITTEVSHQAKKNGQPLKI